MPIISISNSFVAKIDLENYTVATEKNWFRRATYVLK